MVPMKRPAAQSQQRLENGVDVGQRKRPGIHGQDITVQAILNAVTFNQIIHTPQRRGPAAADDRQRRPVGEGRVSQKVSLILQRQEMYFAHTRDECRGIIATTNNERMCCRFVQ